MVSISRFPILLGAVVAGAVWAGPASSGQDPPAVGLSGWEALPDTELLGSNTQIKGSFNVDMTNDATMNGKIKDNVINGETSTGAVSANVIEGNRGMTTVLQNSGNQVNMGANINVNVYLH